ncbi:hypothetical protein [Pseudoalteromonas spongiae]|uniref:hypothetical protein n=1 Tax=Pseudoalteromonas spongiae TaxID=298657 RepID=UPI0012FE5B00|nr:hypothetical protein [Pseudoalteromonas spongiae]
MTFSAELIEKYKCFKNYTQDKQVVSDLDKCTKGNLSQIKKGERHLTPSQTMFLAEAIGMDTREALLQLALEKSKSKEESDVWTDVIKKISAACIALTLCLGLAAETPTKGAIGRRRYSL